MDASLLQMLDLRFFRVALFFLCMQFYDDPDRIGMAFKETSTILLMFCFLVFGMRELAFGISDA